MPIDTTTENVIELRKSPKKILGRPPCIQTLYRWAGIGILLQDGSRVVLETISIGGTRYTSEEAIQRFIDAQNSGASAPVSPVQRQRQSQAARRELANMGIGEVEA